MEIWLIHKVITIIQIKGSENGLSKFHAPLLIRYYRGYVLKKGQPGSKGCLASLQDRMPGRL